MASRAKKPSLAERISNLVTAAPTIFGSDDENEETKAKVVEHYEETEFDEEPVGSTFRKRNVDLLDQIDKRYKGRKVCRKDVYGMESESAESEIENDGAEDTNDESSEREKEDEETSSNGEESHNELDEDEEEGSDSQESNSDTEEDSEVDEDNPLRRERRKVSNFKNLTPTNIHADVEKGNCVREQLKMWENLLEIRIKLQKCLMTANKLPQNDKYQEFEKADQRFKKEADDGRNNLNSLLENLLDAQRNLLDNYSETKNILSSGKTRKTEEKTEGDEMDEEICSDSDEEMEKAEENDGGSSVQEEEDVPSKKKKKRSLAEYENLLAENHAAYRDYRNSVIQKWNDKTRVASGSLNKGSSQAIVKQIEFVLGDKSKLLKRTQLKRSEYAILGKEETSREDDGRRTQDYDTEIYDDDDFYHQLLRELIEYKSSDITDPVQLSKQWIALQNMRSKMKRKIDTRATKGRRIRYNVHNKLVNFMAPVNVNDTWSDLAKNELYNSLFGKIKSAEIKTRPNLESFDNQAPAEIEL